VEEISKQTMGSQWDGKFVAHIRQSDGAVQGLAEHLSEVGELAQGFAAKIGLADIGLLLGLLHDFGKYSRQFQTYINSAEGRISPDADDYVEAGPLKGKIDHSTAGAQYLWQRFAPIGGKSGIGELCGQMLALCIASHHSGLIDCLAEDGVFKFSERMDKPLTQTHLKEAQGNADTELLARIDELLHVDTVKQLFGRLQQVVRLPRNGSETLSKVDAFTLGVLTRFLFSCLIDADRLSSAEFENPSRKKARLHQRKSDNWSVAIDRLEARLKNFSIEFPIDEIRRDISQTCLNRAHDKQGIYSLTVPTGGGKNLASLRFALHHAAHHKLDRIIYIIPYTSIIEQNAQQVRDILESDEDLFSWVLEHHSNIEPDQHNWHAKLVAENWDAPIVFTTMVQFLDTLYAGGTRAARRMHQLAKSVLVFDEIQTLPVKCVHMFCNSVNFLSEHAGTTVLLCTATQPILDALRAPGNGQLKLAKEAELVDVDKLFSSLNRVDINNRIKPGGWDLAEISALAQSHLQTVGSCLVIVNTKVWASDLFQSCVDNVDAEALFHLSTNQCPAHRKALLKTIRQRLKDHLPVLCMSTQLIEAGVDISFASVLRFVAGLDSIAQAAGRCNRHGELISVEGEPVKGQVDVINPNKENIDLLADIKVGREKTLRVLSETPLGQELAPETMERYFQYYFFDRSDQMTYPLTKKVSTRTDTLLNLLSINKFNIGNGNNERASKGKLPLLQQSFKQAGKAFQAIDSPAKSLIVPYGEGREIISALCRLARDFDSAAYFKALKRAQIYSVNLFPNVWDKLIAAAAIHETQAGEGIYYLDAQYYSEHFGVSTEPVQSLDIIKI